MKDNLQVIKIGGNIINDELALEAFLNDFAALKGAKLLVHGGGVMATEMSKRLGIEARLSGGRRITSKEDLEVVTMVYAGLINKNIVASLQAKGCNAIGMSGADGNSVLTSKRPPLPVDYGLVGDVKKVDGQILKQLLNIGLTPVFCAITHDGNGQLLNTNADTMAAEIAIALSRDFNTGLIYCFEKEGVLADINDENSVIAHINSESYEALKASKTIVDGMLPKMENCFHALNHNVQEVIIGSPNVLKPKHKACTTLTLR